MDGRRYKDIYKNKAKEPYGQNYTAELQSVALE